MDRLSFTVALHTARDQVSLAANVFPQAGADLVGAIGIALLRSRLPAHPRQRMKARSLKTASKYVPNLGKHPATAQNYTFHAEVMVMEEGLAPRPQR